MRTMNEPRWGLVLPRMQNDDRADLNRVSGSLDDEHAHGAAFFCEECPEAITPFVLIDELKRNRPCAQPV